MKEGKWIEGYEGFYSVTRSGQVWSVRAGRYLKPSIASGRYEQVTLSVDGEAKQEYVHRLVVQAFHGPAPSPNHQVAHNNGNPRDNCAENLRWATPQENSHDRYRHGTAGKLTVEDVDAIRAEYSTGTVTQHVLAARYGVQQPCISRIVTGESWAVTYDGDDEDPYERRKRALKLTDEEALEIRQLVADGAKQVELAERYGVSDACISHLVRGHTYLHVGGPLMENRKARLDDADVMTARRAYATGLYTQAELAEQFGVSQAAMSTLLRGKTYTHLPLVD